jgi:hypothetical protein
MHSYWSDGHDFPESVAAWFQEHGYHFIAFTEHDQHQVGERWLRCDPDTPQGHSLAADDLVERYAERCGADWVERRVVEGMPEVRLKPLAEYRHLFEAADDFMVMMGEEVTGTWAGDAGDLIHWINVFNAPAALGRQDAVATSRDALQHTFAAAREAGRLGGREIAVYLNHPNFSWNATAEDIAAATQLRHLEIYTALNSCCTYGDESHAAAERIWDVALSLRLAAGEGPLIYGLATDDCHAYYPHERLGTTAMPGRAWVQVRATHLTPDHVLGAINRGDFYGSSSVELKDIQTDERGIGVEIAPAEGTSYNTRFVGTRRGADLSSTPILDAQEKALRTTRRYGGEVGAVLAEVEGLSPFYAFAGDELYVRAIICSDVAHPNPTAPGDMQKAWVQPVRVA